LPEDVVARVGERTITRAEFERMLERQPEMTQNSGPGAEYASNVLQRLIEREALVAKARAAGLHKQPEIAALMDDLLASQYRETRYREWVATHPEITESDIAIYYAAHPEAFEEPAAVRAGVLWIRVSPKALPEQRHTARQRALDVRRQALSVSDDDWQALVQRYSDHQSTRYIGGDTGWIDEGQRLDRWPSTIGAAAFDLEGPGEVADLIEEQDGFYVVRLTARRPSSLRPLDAVREVIAYRLEQQRQHEAREALRTDLLQDVPILVNHSLLRAIASNRTVPGVELPQLPSR
jgi:parvulin-like peptidyl-prolyl isomerase